MRNRSRTSRIIAAVFVGAIAVHPTWGQSRIDGKKLVIPDFDVRDSAPLLAQATTMVEQRHTSIESFLAARGGSGAGMRIVANRCGLPKTLFPKGRTLSAASNQEPEEIARTFLRANSELFPFTAGEMDGLRLVAKDVSGSAVFLTFNQTLNGIDVFNGQIKFALNTAGEVAHAGADEVVPHLSLSTSPWLSADEAVLAAFQSIGIAPPALSPVAAPEGKPVANATFAQGPAVGY
jgi:Zn-dependent metalloprotease